MALPLLVPAIITTVIWSLPGDPASIICPPESSGTEVLARTDLIKDRYIFYNWVIFCR